MHVSPATAHAAQARDELRRRVTPWKILGALFGLGLLAVVGAVAYIEIGCRGGSDEASLAAPHEAIWGEPADTRIEAASWLTYPEWHIVYSAESFAGFLKESRPSRFAYGREIGGFWTSYCAVNEATAGMADRGTYKTTIYIIGVSYTLELAIKAAYEKTVGALTETVAGVDSEDDRYAAQVQADYGAFLHETPWYRYPFIDALTGLWGIQEDDDRLRHWERRLVLSAEYGVKAVYGGAMGLLVGATGQDERTLRFVATGSRGGVTAVDPRLAVRSEPRPGLVLVDAPRYEQFTELTRKLAASGVGIEEIAGNDDIFITALLPVGKALPSEGSRRLFTIEVDDHPGLERAGLTVKVKALLPTIREIAAAGGSLEHVYDY